MLEWIVGEKLKIGIELFSYITIYHARKFF